jgi:hypothetical protein
MAGLLEGMIGALSGAAGYMASSAKSEQDWKEKTEYQREKLEAQMQMNTEKLEFQRDMRSMQQGGGGRGGKGATVPVSDEDYQAVGELSGVPRPQIEQYRNYIKTGQYPTMNQPVTVPNEGQRVDTMLNEGRVIQNVDDAQMDHQVVDPVAEQNIKRLGTGVFGSIVHRALNPALYDGVMKGDQQRMKNGVIEEAIRSKDPKNIPAMATIVRAMEGNGFYAGGENVVTGKAGELGNGKLGVDQQNADAHKADAETRRLEEERKRSTPSVDAGKVIQLRELKSRQESLRILLQELKALPNKSPKDPTYVAKLNEIKNATGVINGMLDSFKTAPTPTPAPEPTNYLKAQIPKVGW